MQYHQQHHQSNQTGRKAQSRVFLAKISDRPLVTYFGTADDLGGLPLASGAIGDFTRRCMAPGNGRRCICCKAAFGASVLPAAFLVAIPAGLDVAATYGTCDSCWDTRTIDEIEKAAALVLRRVIPRGRFLDDPPPTRERP